MRRIITLGIIIASTVLLAPGAAHASCHVVNQTTGDNYGILNGTQINVPVDVVAAVTGLGLGVLGNGTGLGSSTFTENCR